MIVNASHDAVKRRYWTLLREGGFRWCPTCGRRNKLYHRKFNSGMANSLITMYRTAGRNWISTEEMAKFSREEDKIAYWGLLEKFDGTTRPDGGRLPGTWRITDKGVKFVRGNLKIPSHAIVFDSRCLEFDDEKFLDIREALGRKFNYDELMRE